MHLNKTSARWGAVLAAIALLLPSSPALAQQARPAAPSQAVQQQPGLNPAEFLTTAARIAVAVEQGAGAQIWDTSSPVLKKTVARDEFVRIAKQRMAANGPLQGLDWRDIQRSQLAAQQGLLPPGQFISVNFVGLTKDRKAVVETVSFYFDADRTWRLVGLSVR
jgi:hypothetical protein